MFIHQLITEADDPTATLRVIQQLKDHGFGREVEDHCSECNTCFEKFKDAKTEINCVWV